MTPHTLKDLETAPHVDDITGQILERYTHADMGPKRDGFQAIEYFGHRVIAENIRRHYWICRWRNNSPWKFEVRDEVMRKDGHWVWSRALITIPLDELDRMMDPDENMLEKARETLVELKAAEARAYGDLARRAESSLQNGTEKQGTKKSTGRGGKS